MTDTTQGNRSGAQEESKEQAQQAGGHVREKAQGAAGEAKNRVRDQVDQRSTAAGRRVQTTATDIRSVGDELRKQGKDQPAKLADQAAERADRVGGYLERSDGDTILRDVEDFGRRQPWAVVLGGVALGIVASRLLKASSEKRYEHSRHPIPGDLGNSASSFEGDLGQTGATPPTPATPHMAGI